MKKIICFVLAVLLIFAAGCGSKKSIPIETSCEEVVAAVHSAQAVPKFEKYYRHSESNLDASSMSLWADGLYQECKETSLLADYAIYLGAGTDTYEVTVLKARSEDDIKTIEGLIERRKETLAAGDKGMYDLNFEKRIEESVLLTEGKFVIFLVTDDNDAALEAIDELRQ